MVQLFLQGKEAVLPDNASFKLTSENPYFTKSTSYTYDVDLPLSIKQNRDIFGHINRIDVEKSSPRYECELIVDNTSILVGEAHITEVNETSVKVQLLGQTAGYNYGNKMDDVYIDALDLGNWFETAWPDKSYFDFKDNTWKVYDKVPLGNTSPVLYRFFCDHTTSPQTKDPTVFFNNLYSGTYPFVAFPITNASTQEEFNCWRVSVSGASSCYLFPHWVDNDNAWHSIPFACQPYVWLMAEKVAAATGFTLEHANNALYTDQLYKYVFIASANNHMLCNRCLPHWSVNEWWSSIEQTFGVIMSVDYVSHKMYLRKRNAHYTEATAKVNVDMVVNEYTCSMDDETEADISTNNVGFSNDNFNADELLSDDLYAAAVLNKDYESIDDLYDYISMLTPTERKSLHDTIFETSDKRQYIISLDCGNGKEGLKQVNMFRPRIVREDSDDIDIELKMIPSQYKDITLSFWNNLLQNREPVETYAPGTETPGYEYKTRALSNPDRQSAEATTDELDIDAVLSSDAEMPETESPMDLVYLGIAHVERKDSIQARTDNPWTAGYANITVNYPFATLRDRWARDINGTTIRDYNPDELTLLLMQGVNNFARVLNAEGTTIDTLYKYCIKFISDSIPEPGSIFVIRNKKFVCQKIESTISAKGIDKQHTGYFYEFSQS